MIRRGGGRGSVPGSLRGINDVCGKEMFRLIIIICLRNFKEGTQIHSASRKSVYSSDYMMNPNLSKHCEFSEIYQYIYIDNAM